MTDYRGVFVPFVDHMDDSLSKAAEKDEIVADEL